MPTGFWILMTILIIILIGIALKRSEEPQQLTREEVDNKKRDLVSKLNAKRPPIPTNDVQNSNGIYESRLPILNKTYASVVTDEFTHKKMYKTQTVAGMELGNIFIYANTDNMNNIQVYSFTFGFVLSDGVMQMNLISVTGVHFNIKNIVRFLFDNGETIDITFPINSINLAEGSALNTYQMSNRDFRLFTDHYVDKIRFENTNNGQMVLFDLNFDMSERFINKREIQYTIKLMATSLASLIAND